MWPLAVPVALASALLPACLVLVLLALTAARAAGLPAVRALRRLCEFLATWSIVDVFLLAIFVTVVKLAQLTDAAPALGACFFSASWWRSPWPCAASTSTACSSARPTSMPATRSGRQLGRPIRRASIARSPSRSPP